MRRCWRKWNFLNIWSQIDKEGGLVVDVSFRVGEARRAAGTVRKF